MLRGSCVVKSTVLSFRTPFPLAVVTHRICTYAPAANALRYILALRVLRFRCPVCYEGTTPRMVTPTRS